MVFLLFPHQLFEIKYIPKKLQKLDFYLIEHPVFFGFRDKLKMNFNKKKILFHKASCMAYIDYMKSKKINIEYIPYEKYYKSSTFEEIRKREDDTKNEKEIYCFDVVDYQLHIELTTIFENLKVLETPNFLNSTVDLEDYYSSNKSKKRWFHNDFYKNQLAIHDIPFIKKSYDTENREAIPKNVKVPERKLYTHSKKEKSYIQDAIQFVEKHFPNNYGSTDDFYLPIDFSGSKKWMNEFFSVYASQFGKFQDAIIPNEPFLFHSVCSPLINIGLLQPQQLIDSAIQSYKKKQISMNDYEGFVRQIIGWREYQRFIYIFLYDEIINTNYFNNNRKLTKKWYEGKTGILPVDDAIQQAFKYGYLHHIQRLMVMSNIMNLCEFEPIEVYKWFMEFSLDSYDWVMIGNVYSMGLWSDGGLTMRKPYFSSDNYIDKMSGGRYEKQNNWREVWNALYYRFLVKHKNELKKTPYIRNLSHWNKKSKTERNEIMKIADDFINN